MADKIERAYDSRIATRVTGKHRTAMERAAKRAGLDLGAWARLILVAASSPPGKSIAADVARAQAAAGIEV